MPKQRPLLPLQRFTRPQASDRDASPWGELAEWLRTGLQIREHEFESRTRLQGYLGLVGF